ncbi:MAG: hypothetical protein COZ46_08280 [Verrucomicrobia bacterium CG_4_10_14_3_um_filter_43_23]|nr:MAG: hypothetical protein AUJ82_08160 [Verrucomicrobia bacterium CG1_02_43_26]PIP59956.1 MAG: hypothetical protein COX01_01000 [Verrucomicrobia bacterium CG22_combo_CG10-13_8_21_14_all_43_17]PIX57581.1 MAG: hypothetical protein COZ46_08280 [Verrucomicrobia bacterium CG_4_10_14_3_um_filter_43_23]PIY61867.1 MAG: hypothetical protein COY94_03435 [Verrucomicrobia bacterium CG_4_10_14_0_8_um_filter_43_34]PJA44488.1 MAG: hypothetical protein CO175_02900 [Verrucomicrobia bacterium CG_4_9_14_3_um_fi
MKRIFTNVFKQKNEGAAILMVLVVIASVSVILATLLDWGMEEGRINRRYFTLLEGKNATESLVGFGIADLMTRWEDADQIAKDELAPNNSPLMIPDEFYAFYKGSTVLIGSESLSGGPVSEPYLAYIDPNDPANAFDPQKGNLITIRDVNIYTKLSVIVKNNDNIPLYAARTLEIREIPLTNYELYSVMDLEFEPDEDSEEIIIEGPVYTEGNLIGSDKADIYFKSTVSCSSFFKKETASKHSKKDGSLGKVYCKNGKGEWVSNYDGKGLRSTEESFFDSNSRKSKNNKEESDWREVASKKWSGNFKTSDYELPKLKCSGFKGYRGKKSSSKHDSARKGHDETDSDDREYDNERDDKHYSKNRNSTDPHKENEKTSANTKNENGLNYPYALIEPNLKKSDKCNKGDSEEHKLARKAGLIVRLHERKSDKEKLPEHAIHLKDNYYVTCNKLKRTDAHNPTSKCSLDRDGDVEEEAVELDQEFANKLFKMHVYQEDERSKEPKSSFYDARREKGLDVLEVDIAEFRKAVDDRDKDYNPKCWKKGYSPRNDYNGIVYVELPREDNDDDDREDKIVKSKDNMGVLLTNGSKLPDPDYNDTKGRKKGFTLATNNALYIKGNYNADGDSRTGSNKQSDDRRFPDSLAAVACDSLTILSNNWEDSKSKGSKNDRVADFTEYNVAVIAGDADSGQSGKSVEKGGVHRLPRSLEKWTGNSCRHRGSLITAFASEIAPEPFNANYCTPPKSDSFGQFEEFTKGKTPPGMIISRTFYPTKLRFLTEQEYRAEMKQLKAVFNQDI